MDLQTPAAVRDTDTLRQALQHAEALRDALHRSELLTRSGSFTVQAPGLVVALSGGLCALLGEPASGPADGLPQLLDTARWIPDNERALVARFWRGATPGEPFEFQHGLRTRDGRLLQVLHHGLLQPGQGGQPPQGLALLQDITDRRQAEQRILDLVYTCPLTGLPNRQQAMGWIDRALHHAAAPAAGFGLLSIKAGRSAEVTLSLGRGAGDSLTVALAGRLRQLLRDGERLAHLGAGEFALLSPGLAAADQVCPRADALLAALRPPVQVGATEVYLQCRIGVALHPGDGQDGPALLHAALAARRVAPATGGVALFLHESEARERRRLQVESALRHALPQGELSLAYQPQVNLHTGAVVGAETLLRWQSAQLGEVSADEFLPLAERIGLIAPIGNWVLWQACQQALAWRAEGLPPVRLAVPVSSVQFSQSDMAAHVAALLQTTGAEPAMLGIALTESALRRDTQRLATTLRRLQASGVEIVLADFGSGYSNLSGLRHLPIDLVKVDRSFVSDVTAAPKSASVTRSIINLAHGLQIPVMAEGVETPGQLAMLLANGCDRIQGPVFSPPLAADAMADLLRRGQRLAIPGNARTAPARTLLLVDDEEGILSALKRLFRRDGYRILTAPSGADALELLATEPVDVILSDQRMPGMTGVDFLRRTKALHPHTIRMTLSGFTDLQSIIDAVNEGAVYKFLTKPWDDARLR
ncbi:MAG: EAL domain-containing protein, partial [Aquabacterium sp.]|nr:EAL domain-containing protein [Aquabacterium sp.]